MMQPQASPRSTHIHVNPQDWAIIFDRFITPWTHRVRQDPTLLFDHRTVYDTITSPDPYPSPDAGLVEKLGKLTERTIVSTIKDMRSLGMTYRDHADYKDGTNVFPSMLELAVRSGYRSDSAPALRFAKNLLIASGWLQLITPGTNMRSGGRNTADVLRLSINPELIPATHDREFLLYGDRSFNDPARGLRLPLQELYDETFAMP